MRVHVYVYENGTTVNIELVSEYFDGLSAEAKARYTSKVTGVGLRSDPYAIPSGSPVDPQHCRIV